MNKEHLGDARTKMFVYTVKSLNKKHLGDARTQRFVYAVKPLNKEHLGDVMTLIIMTVYMEQNQVCLLFRGFLKYTEVCLYRKPSD